MAEREVWPWFPSDGDMYVARRRIGWCGAVNRDVAGVSLSVRDARASSSTAERKGKEGE